ncbi:Uncharacterised protein [Halioglobus japonicus]|nr:Uncharacterised protein [Halioglobus japonicus]
MTNTITSALNGDERAYLGSLAIYTARPPERRGFIWLAPYAAALIPAPTANHPSKYPIISPDS